MAISETKMQMVIANYFKDECDVNTSIRQAFEKGFRIGVKKGAITDRPQGEWIYTNNLLRLDDEWNCSRCGNLSFVKTNFCDRCGARMKVADRKTEPQTDGYMTAEQTEDYRKMLDKAEHKVYGNIEDEPQTDCSWKKGE